MKTLDDLENDFRNWAPCPPSPRLRGKIFDPPKPAPRWTWNQTGLAFASVLGLALVVAVRQTPPTVATGEQADHAMLAAAMSNQDLAAYVSRGQEWNLPAAGFQYTNIGQPSAAEKLRRPTMTKH